MKKALFILALFTVSFTAMAQKGKVASALSYVDQGILDKAKEYIDQATVNEKTSTWYNTYFAKGKLCQAVFESENPKFKTLYPDPLGEAYTSYEKALTLDTKGSVKNKIITNMVYNSLALNLYSQGSKQFEAEDYAGALKSFEIQIKITESDKYAGSIDTGMYYNAGLAAVNAKRYNTAIKYFEKCAEMKYLGVKPYFDIQSCYLGLGDTLKAESILKNLTSQFPDDNDIYLQLIDIYLKSNKNEEALKYIKLAKERDPDNYTLFFASGIISLNQNNFDVAINDLGRSIAIKSDYFETQYSMGIAYINKAAEMNLKAIDITDIKKYNEAVDQLNGVYARALPYMERAFELKPDDVDAMARLQELYYRLKAKDPSLAKKYLEIKAKIDSLAGK